MIFNILRILEGNLIVLFCSVVMSSLLALFGRIESGHAWIWYGLGVSVRLFSFFHDGALYSEGIYTSTPSIILFIILALTGFVLTYKILKYRELKYDEEHRSEHEALRTKKIKEKSDLEDFKKSRNFSLWHRAI